MENPNTKILNFINVPVKMTSGIDTKSDPKSLETKLTVLQNASFESPGQIEKRDGFIGLSQSIQGGGSISAGVGIASYQNELLAMDGSSIYSYSQDVSKNINKGLLVPIELSTNSIVRNIYQQFQPDSALHPGTGLECFVWSDTSIPFGGVQYTIKDSTTGANLVYGSTIIPLLSNGPQYAKVLTLGSHFIIFVGVYIGATYSLAYYTIDTATPTVISTATTLYTSASQLPIWDATIINNKAYVVFSLSATQLKYYSITSALALSAGFTVTTGHNADTVAIKGDASFNVWTSFSDGAGVYGLIVDAALTTTLLATTLVENVSPKFASNITLIISGTTATIYYEIFNLDLNTSHYLHRNSLTFAGTVGTPHLVMKGVGLASKVFVYNGINYVLVVYYGNIQLNPQGVPLVKTIEPTYFLIAPDGNTGQIIAKLAPDLSGPYYGVGLLPEVVQNGTAFSVAYSIEEDTEAQNGQIVFSLGFSQAIFNFTIPYPTPKLVLGNDLLLASGQLWMYDGQNVVEHGFHIYPENLNIASITLSGGGIGASLNHGTVINQVQYAAIYKWVDNQGMVHRSAVSPALTVQLPVGSTPVTFTAVIAANSTVLTSVSSFTGLFIGQIITDSSTATNLLPNTFIKTLDQINSTITLNQAAAGSSAGDTFSTSDVNQIAIVIPTLRQTLKNNVSIELYRTENNQTIFYEVTDPTNPTINDRSVDFVTFTDTLPDSIIVGNQQLYTTGGEVSNFAAPALSAITTFKNRAIYLSPENPFEYGYSKQVIDGTPVEFSSLDFFENIDQRIGVASAAGPLDDKLILFGPNRKFYVVGNGPAPNGTQNDFTPATIIAGTTGCTNPASVIEIPTGLMYKDPVKGIMLLDRSLQELYIGAEVEAYNSQTITSSNLVPNSRKMAYTLASGANLIYDYFVDQWEVDPFPAAAADSTVFENDFTYIQANGLMLQQTPGVYSDNGVVIPISLTSGWISFAGLEGYQRVKELQLMGTYFSPHTLTINIYSDFGSTPTQTTTIVVGSDPNPYQFRIRLTKQKCETIKIQIVESQSGGGAQGFSLSSVGFRVGMKKGLTKLPAGVSY